MKKIALLAPLLFALISNAQDIIPRPYLLNKVKKEFLYLGKEITIYDEKKLFKQEVDVMAPLFKSTKDITLVYVTKEPEKGPFITLEQHKGNGPEGYSLEINDEEIELRASPAGIFYGLNTLLQIAVEDRGRVAFQQQLITDKPQFSWRGLHLDVSRHFFDIKFVKHYIDMMSRYKYNTFHWHLTDDQGWRIEIQKYPLLTEVGGFRNGTMVGQYRDNKIDNIKYGGYFTQAEIKEVVAYAKLKHITVVPEIEMPGHAVAAIAAYPRLSCHGNPVEVAKIWGVFDDVFCAGNDSVFYFLQDVLDEVCQLFPGEYIHIGGDECPKENWKKCPKCQNRIKSLGLSDEHQLQSYFIQRIEKYLNGKGKKIIGWDEILEGGLAPNAAVMSWRGMDGASQAIKQNHNAVLSPASHCYFDHYQGDQSWEPFSFGGYTSVQKVYAFNPYPNGVNGRTKNYLLGGQANLWSEYILTPDHADYMLWPRACAMAEVLWSPYDKKNANDFLKRLNTHVYKLKAEGINVSFSHYRPTYRTNIVGGSAAIAINPSTSDEIQLEYIPEEGSGLAIQKHEILPDSIVENCTALGTSYQWKLINLPASGKVVFHYGPYQDIRDTLNLNFSLASGKPLSWITKPSNGSAKPETLNDGLMDQKPVFNDRWVKFDSSAVELQIDLEQPTGVSSVALSQLTDITNNIYPAYNLQVDVSDDGVTYKTMKQTGFEITNKQLVTRFLPVKARYIKVKASAREVMPKHQMQFDEVFVY